MNLMTRRQTLAAIAQIAAASSLAACGMGSDDEPMSAVVSAPTSTDLEILASVAYDLFPHQSLSPELYIKVANSILALNDPVVDEGLNQLRGVADGIAWLEVADSNRIEILATIEGSDFFSLMRANTIAVLYSEPAFFELVGYGGSAVELGGYINRGFDDISWLPEQEAAQ
jgi:hypothetical protein